MTRLNFIDSLRGIAILGVIMVHASLYGSFDVPTIFSNFVVKGAMGVQLFFIASALTLYISYNYRISTETNPIRNFFIRRFFRIAPLFYLAIVYYLWQNGMGNNYWLGNEHTITIANIISNFTFTNSFNPYWINSIVPGGWSIAIEMLFYLSIPLLCAKISSLSKAFNFFVATLLLRFGFDVLFKHAHIIASERLWTDYLFFYFPSQLPIFGLGILLYFIVYKQQSIATISKKSMLLFTSLFCIQLFVGIPFFIPQHILIGFCFALLAYSLHSYYPIIFNNKILIYIGKISFSLYIVHFAVLHWLQKFGYVDFIDTVIVNYLIRYGIVIIISVGIASITYFTIEIPGQNLGKRLIKRITP